MLKTQTSYYRGVKVLKKVQKILEELWPWAFSLPLHPLARTCGGCRRWEKNLFSTCALLHQEASPLKAFLQATSFQDTHSSLVKNYCMILTLLMCAIVVLAWAQQGTVSFGKPKIRLSMRALPLQSPQLPSKMDPKSDLKNSVTTFSHLWLLINPRDKGSHTT